MSPTNLCAAPVKGKLSKTIVLALACCARLALAAGDPSATEPRTSFPAQAAFQPDPKPLALVDSKLDGAVIVEAKDALRRGDRRRLAALRDAAVSSRHPLAMWADYWELGSHLTSASTTEVDAFYRRWPGTYVEDRLRNDWLLVVGRRRDWATFSRDFAHYRMNDDREVACYALLTQHLAGHDVRDSGRTAWFAQRDADDGCNVLAATLIRDQALAPADVWQKVHLSIELNRPKAAKQAAALISAGTAQAVAALLDSPAKYLMVDIAKPKRKGGSPRTTEQAPGRIVARSPELAALKTSTLSKSRLGLSPSACATVAAASCGVVPGGADSSTARMSVVSGLTTVLPSGARKVSVFARPVSVLVPPIAIKAPEPPTSVKLPSAPVTALTSPASHCPFSLASRNTVAPAMSPSATTPSNIA